MKLLKLLLAPFYAAVIAAAFLWPAPAKGFIGESSRIVFFHVPCAIVAAIAFLVAGIYSLAHLRTGNAASDDIASAAVRLGLLFAILTIVTGSIFSRIMWGAYWNWDPRQSSYLLLIFVYGAYLFLRAAIEDPEKRTRLAAAYALFAIVPMVFLVFVAPRITQSLHPQTIINPQGKVLMDVPTRVVFSSGLVAVSGLFVWMLSLEARAARLERSSRPRP
jgi:heme exporter protein C